MAKTFEEWLMSASAKLLIEPLLETRKMYPESPEVQSVDVRYTVSNFDNNNLAVSRIMTVCTCGRSECQTLMNAERLLLLMDIRREYQTLIANRN